MISHLSLGVRDLGRSGTFYDAVLAPLGCSRSAGTKMGELAFGPAGQEIFWLYEVADEGRLSSPGTHVALQVADREALHSAADAASEAGCTFTRQAGRHADIGPEYYGAIFLDPDGHKIELVVE
ncbi:MAG TPA: VOC family protein [Sphingomicrobium sp.]|nr:VOC family protein [Sphingomicrobium sp.]